MVLLLHHGETESCQGIKYTHACVHTCTHAHTHAHAYTRIQWYMHVHACTHTHTTCWFWLMHGVRAVCFCWSWWHDSSTVWWLPNHRIVYALSGSLTMENVTLTHAGNYRCAASNYGGRVMSENMTLHVGGQCRCSSSNRSQPPPLPLQQKAQWPPQPNNHRSSHLHHQYKNSSSSNRVALVNRWENSW